MDLPRTRVPSRPNEPLSRCCAKQMWEMSTKKSTGILDRTRLTHFLYSVTDMLSWNKMGDAVGLGDLCRKQPHRHFLNTAGSQDPAGRAHAAMGI